MADRLREAARVIVLDPTGRVLLLHYDEGHLFWAVPGGGLDGQESFAAAACRELREELGITGAVLGPAIARRAAEHQVGGVVVRQRECYFAATVAADSVRPDLAENPEGIRAWRWWTRAELSATAETVYPNGLADLVTRYLEGGPPPIPWDLAG